MLTSALPAAAADMPTFRVGVLNDQSGLYADIAGPGSFSANGYDGQYTVLVPDLDLILVRHGATPLDKKDALKAWVGEVVQCFR